MAGQRIFRQLLPSGLPKCVVDGCNKPGQHLGIYRKDGSAVHRAMCTDHHFHRYGMNGGHRIHRKDFCENIDGRLGHVCTTTITDPFWDLEGDHIDNSHSNNDPSNIQTLCACCHRVKTRLFGHLTSGPYIKKLFVENVKARVLKEYTDGIVRKKLIEAGKQAMKEQAQARATRKLLKVK